MKRYKIKHLLGTIGDGEWMDKNSWEEYSRYIKELKEKGEYLKEVEYTVDVQESPLDYFPNNEKMSAKFIILDLSND